MRSRWLTFSIALAAVLVMALPVVGFAQTSRIEGMAIQGDYVKDYTGIYSYPSCLTSVGNLMYAELGNSGVFNPSTGAPVTFDRQVGSVMDKLFDGRFGTWGIHLRQETPQFGQGDAFSQPGAGFGGADPNHNINEGFDIMWGKKTGTTSLGLRLNRSYQKFEDQIPGVTTKLEFSQGLGNQNLSRNILGFGAGIGFEMSSQTNVELAGQYQSRTYENSVSGAGGHKFTDDGPTTYQIAARAMMQWKPNVMIVPVVKFTSYDLSEKFDNTLSGGAVTSFDNSLHSWQAGISSNWTLGTNDLMVWGVTFAQNKVDQEEDLFGLAGAAGLVGTDHVEITESLMPQVFAALESHVNNWLTLRFGANKGAFQHVKVDDKTTGETENLSLATFAMHIGAGVKVGQLQLDAVLANNFPQTMGWVGSGIPGTYFPKVTATYPF
jgi:hypothetical protein